MGILETVAGLIVNIISRAGYVGIFGLMGLESANIPIPSEIVMPFSGFLASQGHMDFNFAVLTGALGCTIGSLLSFWLGRVSDDTWIKRWLSGWGKVLMTHEELAKGKEWLAKYGSGIIFFARVLPIVRTFISFPAGIARVNLVQFTIYTFLGSLLWSYLLTGIGFQLGENWVVVRPVFQQFEILIILVLVVGIVWFIRHRAKRFR